MHLHFCSDFCFVLLVNLIKCIIYTLKEKETNILCYSLKLIISTCIECQKAFNLICVMCHDILGPNEVLHYLLEMVVQWPLGKKKHLKNKHLFGNQLSDYRDIIFVIFFLFKKCYWRLYWNHVYLALSQEMKNYFQGQIKQVLLSKYVTN